MSPPRDVRADGCGHYAQSRLPESPPPRQQCRGMAANPSSTTHETQASSSHASPSIPPITRDQFDAVLFDLDGVLTSTAAIHAEAWKAMFDDYLRSHPGNANQRRPFDIDGDYKRYVDGKPRYAGVESFLESRGIHLPKGSPDEPPNDRTIAGLGNRKDAMVKRAIDEGKVQPFDGSIRWVRQLKDRGFKLAVVSSSRNAGP